jgi:RNA 2',3'-cyclic 3'-phosphodiesterase
MSATGDSSRDSTVRLFIAIDLPLEVKALLRSLQATLKPNVSGVRWADPDGTHLTLKFLGNVKYESVDEIKRGMSRAASRIHPFELQTTTLGGFPSLQRPRVIWLGITGDMNTLQTTHAAIEQEIAPLGFPTEDRPYHPHLTLGRSVKQPTSAQLAGIGHALTNTKVPQQVGFEVRDIVLMRSELRPDGAHYTPIAHAALDAAG